MYEVTDEFNDAVRHSHIRTARIVTLTSDLVELDSYDGETAIIIEGSVSVDRTRSQRRTLTVRVSNTDGALTPVQLYEPFGLLRMVRVDRGILLEDGPEWVPLGVFIVENPKTSADASGSTITFQGTDRMRLMADSKFASTRVVAAGTRVADAVRAIAEEAGMGSDEVLYELDDGGATILDMLTWDEETPLLDAAVQLADDHALELYANQDGALVLKPITDPSTEEIVWEFEPGETSIMVTVDNETSSAQLFNRMVVVGESASAGPFRGEARDLNPASPIYNPADGSGPVGDRMAPIYRSALITSFAQAQQVAEARLLEVALIEEDVTVTMAPHPALDAGDVVSIFEPLTGSSGRYRIDTLDVPLGGGTMMMSTKRVRSLS